MNNLPLSNRNEKLLLIDKDGTLVNPHNDKTFPEFPWDQVPIPGMYEKLYQYNFLEGWEIMVISNQGGVIAGYKSQEFAQLEMKYLLQLFPQISECYFCPSLGESCWRITRSEEIRYDQSSWVYRGEPAQSFRKPGAGMLTLARGLYAPSGEVLYVGDRSEDEQAAINAGIPFLFADDFLNNPSS